MARKPNYRFERQERDRKKAEKKEAKQQAKLARRTGEVGGPDGNGGATKREAPETEVDQAPSQADKTRLPEG